MSRPTLLWWHAPGRYRVAFTTRAGGVSDGRYASLNLGVFTGDEPARVEENRRLVCRELEADPDGLALNHQVHGSDVHEARPGARGQQGDGLWTDRPGLPLVALTADCLPVVVARANGAPPALALLHVGWRGLAAGVIAVGAARLGPGALVAAIGPGIGPCCYEVGPDVAARFDGDLTRAGKLDLWTAAERALLAAGVQSVERLNLCTACDPDLFFSHRRDRGDTGRQGVIGLVA